MGPTVGQNCHRGSGKSAETHGGCPRLSSQGVFHLVSSRGLHLQTPHGKGRGSRLPGGHVSSSTGTSLTWCKPMWVPRRLCGWLQGSHSHLCASGTQGDPVPTQRGSLGTTTASTGNLLEAQNLSLPSPHPTPSHQNLHLSKTPQRESPSCQSLGSPELGTASWPDK